MKTRLQTLISQDFGYKQIINEKSAGRLSHAYLILGKDGEHLLEIAKQLAKVCLCAQNEPCEECRNCLLIEQSAHQDVLFYAKQGFAKTEDITDVIEQSYIKPVEAQKKVFIINNANLMQPVAQNKLLKTLEEPPKNVHIFLIATSEYGLLPTVLSRVKKVACGEYSEQALFDFLKVECEDSEKLKRAIENSDKTVSSAKERYFGSADEFLQTAISVAVDMQNSKDVLAFGNAVMEYKDDLNVFLDYLEGVFRDLLCVVCCEQNLVQNKQILSELLRAVGYKKGSVLNAIDLIGQAKRRIKANSNAQMVVEWLLFGILEGKHKWQKL